MRSRLSVASCVAVGLGQLYLFLLWCSPCCALEVGCQSQSSQGQSLGQTSLRLERPGALGTWSWGNKLLYSYSPEDDDNNILSSYGRARKLGLNLFDTGDSYGTGKLQGNAERLLARCHDQELKDGMGGSDQALPDNLENPIFLSKIAVYPWLFTSDAYYSAILSSRERLGISRGGTGAGGRRASFVPSIHWSPKTYFPMQTPALYAALARCYENGLCEGVGLSNLGPNELLKAADYFQGKNVPIAANQIQCSLISDFEVDVEPALRVANEMQVTTLGYSPLGLGLLCSGQPTDRGKIRSLLFGLIKRDESGKVRCFPYVPGRMRAPQQQNLIKIPPSLPPLLPPSQSNTCGIQNQNPLKGLVEAARRNGREKRRNSFSVSN